MSFDALFELLFDEINQSLVSTCSKVTPRFRCVTIQINNTLLGDRVTVAEENGISNWILSGGKVMSIHRLN